MLRRLEERSWVGLAAQCQRCSQGRSRSYGRRRSYGRSRSYGRIGRYQARAIARRAYVRAKWPSSEFAHIRVQRGSQAAAALGISPGVSFKDADAEEQQRRRQMQWYGKGGYFGKLIGGALGGAAGSYAGVDPTIGASIGSAIGDKAGDWLYDQGRMIAD